MAKIKHVMLDLETMGNGPYSAVIQIGAVEWGPGFVREEGAFSCNISLVSCVEAGLKIEPRTVMWWLGQSELARKSLTTPLPITLREALQLFSKWYPGEDTVIWGYGSGFDNTRLREAYYVVDENCPWSYRDDRDVRTLLDLAGQPDALRVERFDSHNALADAVFQAKVCSQLLEKVKHG